MSLPHSRDFFFNRLGLSNAVVPVCNGSLSRGLSHQIQWEVDPGFPFHCTCHGYMQALRESMKSSKIKDEKDGLIKSRQSFSERRPLSMTISNQLPD